MKAAKLRLLRLGTVGRAVSLTLAAILACCLTASLALAVILALTGVLRGIGRGLGEEYTGLRRWGGSRARLCVHANRGAAEKACDCGGQSEGLCGVLHEMNLSVGYAAHRVHWAVER
jgi:hypothetical protein